ncbi:MAG: class I SAM-dependent methyltransferase [bacterium]
MLQQKEYFIEKLEQLLGINQNSKILDLGSGKSINFIPLLKKYPEIHYIGVEPNQSEAETAKKLLKHFKNATVHNQLAYELIENQNDFDICISLSVLEHIKQLDKFLINSIRSVKTGGYIIHRYDLGHALYPSSLKERLHIFLGNNFPKLLPQKKFVRYLSHKKVCEILEKNGAEIQKITYHQMPNHKAFLKNFNTNSDEKLNLAKEILDWEFRVSKHLSEMQIDKRELLFPAITIWAKKK